MKPKWYNRQGFWIVLTVLFMFCLLLHSMKDGTKSGAPASLKQLLYSFAHVPAYSLLTVMLYNAIHRRSLAWAFFIAAANGILNEWVQSFNPGRTASVMDFILDLIGAGIIIWIIKNNIFELKFCRKEGK